MEGNLTVDDLIHSGPGTLAGSYLRAFWQPVYRAADLAPGRSIPLRIMSEDFTLYRGEAGEVHLVAFRCAHRGTQLSVGWVEGDCIRCRYHGWKYDSSGQCVEQPGEDPGYAAKVSIRAYPVREYLGLVWAHLGEGEPPPFRRYPSHERPGVLEVTAPEYLPCNYVSRMENDPAHVPWTHRVSRSRAGTPAHEWVVPASLSAEETPWGFSLTIVGLDGISHTNNYYMPNAGQHHSTESEVLPGRVESERITWTVPVDDYGCLHFGLDLILVEGEQAETVKRALEEKARREGTPAWRLEMGEAVLAGKLRLEDLDPNLSTFDAIRVEDHATMVGQGRINDRSNEHLGRIDAGTVFRRKLWLQELEAIRDGRPLTEWRMPDGLIGSEAAEAVAV